MSFFSALGGLASIGGAITGQPWLTAAGSALGALGQQDYNAEQAQQNRDFQAQQSDTAMQRRVADLKAAGLSPMLAYSQGGASSAAGAQASSNANAGESSATSGVQAAQLKTNIDLAKSQISLQEGQRQLADSQMLNTDADTELKILNSKHVPYQIKKTIAEIGLLGIQTRAGLANARQTEYLLPRARSIGNAWGSAAGAAAGYGAMAREGVPSVGINLGKLGRFGLSVD